MNGMKPYLWGGLVIAAVILSSGISYLIYQRSRPITVNDVNGPRVLIPANSWQVLPSHRSDRALPEPDSPEVLLQQTPIPLAVIDKWTCSHCRRNR